MKKLFIFLLFLSFSCTNLGIKVQVEEIKNDIVRVSISNNSETDYATLTFIIDYLDKDKKLLLTDTIPYQNADGYFLPAKSETFIVQKIPSGTYSVECRLDF